MNKIINWRIQRVVNVLNNERNEIEKYYRKVQIKISEQDANQIKEYLLIKSRDLIFRQWKDVEKNANLD